MDEDAVFLTSLFASAPEIRGGLSKTLDYCRSKYELQDDRTIDALPIEKEAEELQVWVERVLLNEPPPPAIQAFYFGLFHSISKESPVRPCLYISGSDLFDQRNEDSDWACSPSYFPKGRYAISEVLASLERFATNSEKKRPALSSILQLSFTGLCVSRIMRRLPKELVLGNRNSRGLAIGFDEGDLFLLPTIER